ncbi:MAG: biopolymer transporter ExbD [Myxococcota bacterium]
MQVGSRSGMQAELNVTPMIDVVLVLLIIFMVVTPLLEQKLPVVVPQESAPEAPAPSADPLVMVVDASGALSLGAEKLEGLPALKSRLAAALATREDKDRVVFLDAHDNAPYDRAVDAMDTARQAGAKHIGIIDPLPPAPAPAAP